MQLWRTDFLQICSHLVANLIPIDYSANSTGSPRSERLVALRTNGFLGKTRSLFVILAHEKEPGLLLLSP